jgi:hypothetical protein
MTQDNTPAGTAHAASNETTTSNSINQIDAFTRFINEWIDLNVKVFTRGGNKHDSEVL